MSGSWDHGTMSIAEYRQWERTRNERHEYWNGKVYLQSSGSRRHSLIGANLLVEIHGILKGNPCEVHGSDMRVYIPATRYQAYPDVSFVCPPIEADDEHEINNPVLVA